MRASLDTNAIIHFYQVSLQNILFEFFSDGVMIFEQIRNVELEHHASGLLEVIDKDIAVGRIEIYTIQCLKEQAVYKIFEMNVNENKLLYGAGDLGEIYAISLAQTLGAYALVTDDIKQGGPYMSLMQFEDGVMPFHFADVVILRYLIGSTDAFQAVAEFNAINEASNLNWVFRSQIAKFVKRFWKEPYKEEDRQWIDKLMADHGVSVKRKLTILSKLVP